MAEHHNMYPLHCSDFQIIFCLFACISLILFYCSDDNASLKHFSESIWWHHVVEALSTLLAFWVGNPSVFRKDHAHASRFVVFCCDMVSFDLQCHIMGLLPDTQNWGLRMRQECRERFPHHRGLAIPTCITARVWRTCRDACRDR